MTHKLKRKKTKRRELERRNNKKYRDDRVKAGLPESVTAICPQCGVNLYGKKKLPLILIHKIKDKKWLGKKWCEGCPDALLKPCQRP